MAVLALGWFRVKRMSIRGFNDSVGCGRLYSRSALARAAPEKFEYPVNLFHRVERIILIRHGESEGNLDSSAYVDTADWRIPTTIKGKEQAVAAGHEVRKLLGSPDGPGRAFFYVSPYLRTRETLEGVLSQLERHQVTGVREEPRISEQQFGNFQCVSEVETAKEERRRFGRFYYRFPNGEAGFDVFNRVTSFISTMLRDCAHFRAEGQDLTNFNLCIVTHGLTLRLFLMRWFQFTVEEFEESFNPRNGSVVVLERHTNPISGLQWFDLHPQALQDLNLPSRENQSKFRIMEDPTVFK